MKRRSDPIRPCKTCGATLIRRKSRNPDRRGYYHIESTTNFDKRNYCDDYCRRQAPTTAQIDWTDPKQVATYRREYSRQRRERDPDAAQHYAKKWRKRNPDYWKKYYAANADKMRENQRRYRERLKAGKKAGTGARAKVRSLLKAARKAILKR